MKEFKLEPNKSTQAHTLERLKKPCALYSLLWQKILLVHQLYEGRNCFSSQSLMSYPVKCDQDPSFSTIQAGDSSPGIKLVQPCQNLELHIFTPKVNINWCNSSCIQSTLKRTRFCGVRCPAHSFYVHN